MTIEISDDESENGNVGVPGSPPEDFRNSSSPRASVVTSSPDMQNKTGNIPPPAQEPNTQLKNKINLSVPGKQADGLSLRIQTEVPESIPTLQLRERFQPAHIVSQPERTITIPNCADLIKFGLLGVTTFAVSSWTSSIGIIVGRAYQINFISDVNTTTGVFDFTNTVVNFVAGATSFAIGGIVGGLTSIVADMTGAIGMTYAGLKVSGGITYVIGAISGVGNVFITERLVSALPCAESSASLVCKMPSQILGPTIVTGAVAGLALVAGTAYAASKLCSFFWKAKNPETSPLLSESAALNTPKSWCC